MPREDYLWNLVLCNLVRCVKESLSVPFKSRMLPFVLRYYTFFRFEPHVDGSSPTFVFCLLPFLRQVFLANSKKVHHQNVINWRIRVVGERVVQNTDNQCRTVSKGCGFHEFHKPHVTWQPSVMKLQLPSGLKRQGARGNKSSIQE